MKWQGQVSDPDRLVPESMLLTTELHCLAETTGRGDTVMPMRASSVGPESLIPTSTKVAPSDVPCPGGRFRLR